MQAQVGEQNSGNVGTKGHWKQLQTGKMTRHGGTAGQGLAFFSDSVGVSEAYIPSLSFRGVEILLVFVSEGVEGRELSGY